MSEFDQVPFGAAEFAENPEPRCPCLLLLDTSGSMSGKPIQRAQRRAETFKDELMADAHGRQAGRGGRRHLRPGPGRRRTSRPPTCSSRRSWTTSGDTPMGAAIEHGLEMLRERKEIYKQNGISYYRPWIFLITDGAPTDAWRTRRAGARGGGGEVVHVLRGRRREAPTWRSSRQIAVREPLKLNGLRFRDLFSWLSNSLGSVSRSNPGDRCRCRTPRRPDGWATPDEPAGLAARRGLRARHRRTSSRGCPARTPHALRRLPDGAASPCWSRWSPTARAARSAPETGPRLACRCMLDEIAARSAGGMAEDRRRSRRGWSRLAGALPGGVAEPRRGRGAARRGISPAPCWRPWSGGERAPSSRSGTAPSSSPTDGWGRRRRYAWVFWPRQRRVREPHLLRHRCRSAADHLQFDAGGAPSTRSPSSRTACSGWPCTTRPGPRTPPFFRPMFAAVRAAAGEAAGVALRRLAAYLSSPPVNERTDDDKTLILATRRP